LDARGPGRRRRRQELRQSLDPDELAEAGRRVEAALARRHEAVIAAERAMGQDPVNRFRLVIEALSTCCLSVAYANSLPANRLARLGNFAFAAVALALRSAISYSGMCVDRGASHEAA